MKCIETDERLTGHIYAAPQKRLYEISDEWQIACSTGCNSYCCKSPFIPQHEIATQAKEDGYAEEYNACNPQELPWFSVRFQKERTEGMDKEDKDGKLGTPVVEGAEEPSHIELCDNLDNALMGNFVEWHIIECKDNTGDELDDEEKHGNAACIVPEFVFVLGHELVFSERL